MTISCEELREICKLTVELTRLKQDEWKHLCVENAGPEIFVNLLSVFDESRRPSTRHMSASSKSVVAAALASNG